MSVNQAQKSAYEEGVALGLLEELGDPPAPIDAFELARGCGLRVIAGSLRGARLSGDTIEVNIRARHERQHGLVAHELGHWALQRARENDTEAGAAYVGAALLLPQREFSRDLRDTAWDLRQLKAKHVNASAELIARRIAALRDACVTIWDNGKLTARVASPWLPSPYRRLSTFERELAARVLASGETERAGELLWGFAVFSGAWKRVVTVCEAEQLAIRF